MRLTRFIERSLATTTEQALFAAFRDYCAEFGADVCSYHITAAHLRRLKLDEGFHFNGFPDDWVDLYRERQFFEIDPIIGACMSLQQPFHWLDVGLYVPLTEAQRDYLACLRARFMDGIAIPIFGAQGTSAYFGVGAQHLTMPLSPMEMLELQYGCNQVHIRFLEIHGDPVPAQAQPLSSREREVLGWVARGKSNGVIAQLLGVSEHTVDTLVRRMFAKLGVSDRISAALKGVGMGMVTL